MSNNSHTAPLASVETVLLAAGLSRRMGETNKLLLNVKGIPLVRRSAQAYLGVTRKVTVVTGHEADRIKEALAGLPVTIVNHPKYEQGQQSSVRFGLSCVSPDSEAVIIALADQPLLTPADIAGLILAYMDSDRERVMIPYYQGVRGNPVVLPRAILDRLERDPANPTCRKFIDANPDLACRYDAPKDHFTTDVDTPHDAVRFSTEPPVSLRVPKHVPGTAQP